MKPARQWSDGYGPKWYLHRDGTPPRDDDRDYIWDREFHQWVPLDDFETDQ
jgi:hypothetical protein